MTPNEGPTHDPISPGDTVSLTGRVVATDAARHRVTLELSGPAALPATAGAAGEARAGNVAVRFHALIAAAAGLPPARTAVVHPCDALSLTGAIEAARRGMIVPVMVGPRTRIEATAKETGVDLAGFEIVDAPHSHAAAERAVMLVREGRADVLMKGKLHTDELLEPIVDREKGLRTERRMSHVFALDVPDHPKLLFITDAAINIFPDLETKRDIVQNAIDLAQSLGIVRPKVALLSAVETVYAKIPSTIEAAALCKMLDRGQISGGLLDGPLGIDNALSREAAEAKGIRSEVAGDADILVAPDLEAGNMIAKQLVYLAGAEAAGIVLGARVPIILTSRADGVLARLASTAMAQIHASRRRPASG